MGAVCRAQHEESRTLAWLACMWLPNSSSQWNKTWAHRYEVWPRGTTKRVDGPSRTVGFVAQVKSHPALNYSNWLTKTKY